MNSSRLAPLHLALLRTVPNAEQLSAHLLDLYNTQQVYWYSLGSDCLVALNPVRQINGSHESIGEEELYGTECAAQYAELAPSYECAIPHIYGVAARLYYELATLQQSRSVACIGTQGTGKSETCKLLVQQLLLTGPIGPSVLAGVGGGDALRQRVNASFLLLDAFSCHSNSSSMNHSLDSKTIHLQYGWYSEGFYLNGVQFKSNAFDYWHVLGQLGRGLASRQNSTHSLQGEAGSKHSLSTPHHPAEHLIEGGRNFHIFHQLLAGLPVELANAYGLSGKSASNWKILGHAQAKGNENEDDKDAFLEVQQAFNLLGIEQHLVTDIYSMLAGIIHLGNIEFVAERTKIQASENAQATVKHKAPLEQAAFCLGLTEIDLETHLLQSLELVSGERCSVFLGVGEAEMKRDCCIAFLYWSLYQWLLCFINNKLTFHLSNEEGESLKISIFDAPSANSSERHDSIDFRRSVLHHKWNELFFNEKLKAPIEIFTASGFDCAVEEGNYKSELIEECEDLLCGTQKENQQTCQRVIATESSVQVEWNAGIVSSYSLLNSPHQLAIWNGSIHCDLIDLARNSTNLILDSIGTERAIIVCTDFRHKQYATKPQELIVPENISYWIVHLNPLSSLLSLPSQLDQFQLVKVLQRKKIAFDIWLDFDQFIAKYSKLFDSMRIPKTVENILPFLQLLHITPGMYSMAPNKIIFLAFETVQLLDECYQDIEYSIKDWMPRALSFEPYACQEPTDEYLPLVKEIPRFIQKSAKIESQTVTRRKWLAFTRLITWWIPDKMLVHFGKMSIPEVRQAWREKVTLCFVILLFSSFMLFNVTMLAKLICPTQHVFTKQEVEQFPITKPHIIIFGRVYDITKLIGNPAASMWVKGAGTDMSKYFRFTPLCGWLKKYDRGIKNPADGYDIRAFTPYYVGDLGFARDYVNQYTGSKSTKITVNNKVYDITQLVAKGAKRNINYSKMTERSYSAITSPPFGIDKSGDFKYPGADKDVRCLSDFFEGVIDQRNSFRCKFAEYLLIGCTGVIVAIMVVKFIAAIQFPTRRDPEEVHKYVIMQVPCYTENEQSLRITIESLACMDYEDEKKLLFVICDGMLIGSGNDKPTVRIVLDILGVSADIDPEPLSYLAIADGPRRHNQAKVYAGLYRIRQHVVPFIVLAKCGAPQEIGKPGNRGKRDSQMILLNLLNKLYHDKGMTPMELEICRSIHSVIGVDPKAYEFILQVDADTEVAPDALTKMISALNNDSKIIGLCGETEVGNEKASLITMIQVYEYYISHHLAKAFESLFGTVTCLPGCFSIFRIRSIKNEIYLVADPILAEYSDISVNTLHKKNLLHLGEDRFLTTLLIKNFPYQKLCFIGDAKCRTIVPDSWRVLLSQRRRWINSTVHNLFELILLNELCGFCFFSMKFVVIIDLFATLVMPATVIYLVYLIIASIAKQRAPIISLIMFSLAYGMQAIIFLCKGQLQHIGWMLLNILSMPIFNFFIPLYSFWHFDNFSWGSTRRVVGEDGQVRHEIVPEEGKFDEQSVSMAKWSEYCMQQMKMIDYDLKFGQEQFEGTIDPLFPNNPIQNVIQPPSTGNAPSNSRRNSGDQYIRASPFNAQFQNTQIPIQFPFTNSRQCTPIPAQFQPSNYASPNQVPIANPILSTRVFSPGNGEGLQPNSFGIPSFIQPNSTQSAVLSKNNFDETSVSSVPNPSPIQNVSRPQSNPSDASSVLSGVPSNSDNTNASYIPDQASFYNLPLNPCPSFVYGLPVNSECSFAYESSNNANPAFTNNLQNNANPAFTNNLQNNANPAFTNAMPNNANPAFINAMPNNFVLYRPIDPSQQLPLPPILSNGQQQIEPTVRAIVQQTFFHLSNSSISSLSVPEELHLKVKKSVNERLEQLAINPVLVADLVDQEIILLMGNQSEKEGQ